MLNLPIERAQARSEPAGPTSFDGVMALVGIGGSWTGMGRISCSANFARRLAGALLMTTFEDVDDDVLDAMAEVANMIVGSIKTGLEEKLGSLALSTPSVIFGRNYRTRSAGVLEWMVMPFMCEGESLEVRFHLLPTGVHPHAALRPEHFHV
jgi:chemotaxis protein CheX